MNSALQSSHLRDKHDECSEENEDNGDVAEEEDDDYDKR